MQKEEIEQVLARVTATTSGGAPDARVKQVVDRLLHDLFIAIEDLNITPDEFWSGISYLTWVGQRQEFGLLTPGLGIEHFLDLRMDEAECRAGIEGGTSRTIEGPLYVKGAPLTEGLAQLDDPQDEGELLFASGQVLDLNGEPLPGAIVEVWHADGKGMYSHFDPSQAPFHLRRKIKTGSDGRYEFRTVMPSGYCCPPDGPTQHLLDLLGRHGHRPAHIHFLVAADGHRALTTQINIAGDEYLHNDFAFATRDDLIVDVKRHDSAEEIRERGVNSPYATIEFNFVLKPARNDVPYAEVHRDRVAHGG